jgi:hypothetical protein
LPPDIDGQGDPRLARGLVERADLARIADADAGDMGQRGEASQFLAADGLARAILLKLQAR